MKDSPTYTVIDEDEKRGIVLCNTETRRGVICLDNTLRTPIWPGAPYDDEYVDQLPSYALDDMRMYTAYEGLELRLYVWHGVWQLSTLRCVDASQSRWGCALSHRELFEKALVDGYGLTFNEFTARLIPTQLYVFFLKNYDRNRVANFAGPYPLLYHVETFTHEWETVACTTAVRKQTELYESDILAYVRNMDPQWTQGVILMNGNRRVKVMNRAYAELEKLRGGESCIVRRYLALRASHSMTAFVDLYSELGPLFRSVELQIQALEGRLLAEYENRYFFEKHVWQLPVVDTILRAVRRRVHMFGDKNTVGDVAALVHRAVLKLDPRTVYVLL